MCIGIVATTHSVISSLTKIFQLIVRKICPIMTYLAITMMEPNQCNIIFWCNNLRVIRERTQQWWYCNTIIYQVSQLYYGYWKLRHVITHWFCTTTMDFDFASIIVVVIIINASASATGASSPNSSLIHNNNLNLEKPRFKFKMLTI